MTTYCCYAKWGTRQWIKFVVSDGGGRMTAEISCFTEALGYINAMREVYFADARGAQYQRFKRPPLVKPQKDVQVGPG